MPPVPVGGTELRPVVMLVASNYLPRLLLLLFLSFGAAIIYIFTHTHTHKDIGKFVPLHSCAATPATAVSLGSEAQLRYMTVFSP